MNKRTKILMLAFLIMFLPVCFNALNVKKDINKATYKELEALPEIGDKLAKDILAYVADNDVNTVKDIEIKYLGEKRLKELRKIYK